MIGSSLLRYQDNQRFLVIDTESNGLNLARSLPWQIAYSICTIRGIESTNVRHILWPDMEMSDDAARVNRFDRKAYLSVAEDPRVVLEDFEKLLMDDRYLLVGHNLMGFDHYMLNVWRKLCGKQADWSFVPRTVDTLCLSRAYRHQIQPDLNNFTAWQYKMLTIRGTRQKGMGCSLGAMAKEFGVPYDERTAHDAGVDIGINYEVYKKLIWSIEV